MITVQRACYVVDQMLRDELTTVQPSLNAEQFASINAILLEMAADGKYILKDEKEQAK